MTHTNRWIHLGLVLLLAGACLALTACQSKPKRPMRAVDRPIVSRDVHPILSNTIGAQANISGMTPEYVSGYGLVVGLNGTGSSDAPLTVRAMLEDEMLRLGVGDSNGPLADVSPARMIDDRNTAVVLVQAFIPPASPEHTPFDVLVTTLPGTATTSLEGGILYTTNLYRGMPIPGGPTTNAVAEARGPIFINPFVDPAIDPVMARDGVNRIEGRILGGGRVRTVFRPVINLDNPSHSRALAMTASINARFPQLANRTTVARGMSDENIELNVPRSWRPRMDDFFQIVLHTRVDRAFPEQWARRYAETLVETPELADQLVFCFEAIGEVSMPVLRPLYTHSESAPRRAALTAGARLADPLTRPHLEEIVSDGPAAMRTDAIELLAGLPPDLRINTFLRRLLNSSELDTRIAAYEALLRRAEPRITRVRYADKFVLDLVPSDYNMIYVTQQGQPRIALFGDLRFNQPALISGWDGRLMITTDSDSPRARIFYRDFRRPRSATHEIGHAITEFIDYLVHEPTPEEPMPGLNFSYSQTVGALYEVIRAGGVDAEFVPETDRLALELLREFEGREFEQRPELSPEGAVDRIETPETRDRQIQSEPGDETDQEREERRRRYVRPLAPPPETNNSGGRSPR